MANITDARLNALGADVLYALAIVRLWAFGNGKFSFGEFILWSNVVAPIRTLLDLHLIDSVRSFSLSVLLLVCFNRKVYLDFATKPLSLWAVAP